MENFTAFFDAFETRVHSGNENLLQRQQSNTMKQETIACLNEKIARYKQQESEQRVKRENAEQQRKELMGKLSASLTCAKTLHTECEKFSEQSAIHAKIDHELRAKMGDISAALARIADSEKQLRDQVQNLKKQVTFAPQDIAAFQQLKSNVKDNLKKRSDAFDLTALVAEIQAIEQQGKERQKMSEELHEKFGYSSAQVADNEMLQERLDNIQNEVSNTEDERRKVAEQKYAVDNKQMETALEEENFRKEIGAFESELDDVEHQTRELKQKQAENEARITSTSLELEEMRAKVQQEVEALKVSKEDHENKKMDFVAEMEKVESGFHYHSNQMLEQLENGRKAVEGAKAECEKLKESERFSIEYEEISGQNAELNSKLPELKEECEELRKKVEEKKSNLAVENLKIGDLRQGAESNKLAKEKELEDANAEMSRMEAEILRMETDAEDIQNKKYELEGEIHLLKHQLSTKGDELATAKENFCRMQEATNAVAKEKTHTQNSATGEREEGNVGKGNLSRMNARSSPMKRRTPKQKPKSPKQKPKSSKQSEKIVAKRAENHGSQMLLDNHAKGSSDKLPRQQVQANHGKGGEALKSKNNAESFFNTDREESDTRNVDSDGVKSASLQNTNTLASTLAEEFKRDIAVDLDDSMMVEDDDNDELFGDLTFGTPLNKSMAAVPGTDNHDASIRVDEDIHFEPNELFTSTPLIVKKQCTVRPTRVKSSTRNTEPSSSQGILKMPPMRRSSGESAAAPHRRGKNRGRPRWRP